nr:hypothetical protein [Tanacetum cinerariifolium]
MSDSEDFIITYTAVSSPYGGLTSIGSPGVDRPPVIPVDPYAYVVATFHALPSPDYVSGPEYPPSLEFVPEPVYPEFMPAEDDILPAEEQPLPAAASPTVESLSYIDESDPEEDPKDDLEEDPADYLADGGEEGDDEDESSDDDENESSDDEEDEDIDIEGDEYLAPADSTVVALPAIDHASSAEETEPFETDESAATPPPHPTYSHTYSTTITTLPIIIATTTTTTTSVTNAQLEALIEQGVARALAARDAHRNTNDDDNHNSGTGARRTERVTRERTYPDFMKCKPLNFKGTEGVVELTQWFEKMESVFRLSNCSMENQIKFSICTLLGSALTWWNSHVTTVGLDAAYAMTWVDMKKKMTDKYCPRGEMKKLKSELWNLRVKSNDVGSYNQRFQELALLCVRIFPEEADKIKRYVGGLPDVIYGSVAENKRKVDDTFRSNQSQQQQQNKRQNTGRAYTVGSGEKKSYGGSKPLCPKCNYHHDGPCAPKCFKCNKVGHITRDCRGTSNVNTANNQRGDGTGQKPTCYECGSQGHFRKDCPKFKNINRGTQDGNAIAPAKVSFVSTAFSSQIAITPTALDYYYDVKLADGRIIGLNSILRGCTLNFLNHPFNIDLMPVELGSFDAIIGMDWLAKYHPVIVCADKIVRIPWGNETLIVHGDESNRGNATRLNIISCAKTQ